MKGSITGSEILQIVKRELEKNYKIKDIKWIGKKQEIEFEFDLFPVAEVPKRHIEPNKKPEEPKSAVHPSAIMTNDPKKRDRFMPVF